MAIDCAIIGRLTPDDQDYLARNLIAFFNRDYSMVAELHLESGWIPEDTDVAEFEQVIREVCEPIFAKPLSEISFGHFLVTLFQTARAFNMEVQPQLVLLQKTLLNIEGLGRQLYPELDLWQTAKPFMESWMLERTSPAATLRSFNENAPSIAEALPRLPNVLAHADRDLKRLDRRAVQHGARLARLEAAQRRLTVRHRLVKFLALALLLLLTGILWPQLDAPAIGAFLLITLALVVWG